VLLALPSEGGALTAGTHCCKRDSTAGDMGNFAGGVGGTGDDFKGLLREAHTSVGGIIIDGYLFRLDDELATLFRLESVAKLVGLLEIESRMDGDWSLNWVSLSLTS
jgi:hypothetical protein